MLLLVNDNKRTESEHGDNDDGIDDSVMSYLQVNVLLSATSVTLGSR